MLTTAEGHHSHKHSHESFNKHLENHHHLSYDKHFPSHVQGLDFDETQNHEAFLAPEQQEGAKSADPKIDKGDPQASESKKKIFTVKVT